MQTIDKSLTDLYGESHVEMMHVFVDDLNEKNSGLHNRGLPQTTLRLQLPNLLCQRQARRVREEVPCDDVRIPRSARRQLFRKKQAYSLPS